MKVVYVTLSQIPHFGGKSTVILSEAERIAAHDKVCIICLRPSGGYGKSNGISKSIPVTHIDSTRPKSLLLPIKMTSEIRRVANKEGVEVVSSHDVYGALAAILAGLRKSCLLTLHSTFSTDRFIMEENFDQLPLHKKTALKLRFLIDLLVEVVCYNLVRGIICVSENELEDALRKTVSKAKVFLVRNGIDTERYRPSAAKRKEVRERLGFAASEVVFLYIGRMVPKNGPFTIAQAIPYVASRCSNSQFIFVGQGPEKKRCEDHLNQAGMMNRVRFREAQEAIRILPVADVFVSHVSSLVQGVGLTVLEALAEGLPVILGLDTITEKIGKCSEELMCVRKDDPEALADCMIELAMNPRRRLELSLAGRRMATREFSLAKRIRMIEEIYRRLT